VRVAAILILQTGVEYAAKHQPRHAERAFTEVWRIPTLIGQTLAHYRITAAIGSGGMGEVFRGTDTKLGRDVALKLLPAAFAADPERLARFEREAKLLASLNHPGIAHLYGFETATVPDGSPVHFLAMELVEGEDLAERLKRGPIPVDEALAIARQIAEALEEAHEKGIVHRDLKPGNVKVTPDGKVKVLDFGLAKAWSGEGHGATSSVDLSQSPTLAHTGTAAGLILGTAAYMSPEQARGRPVDRRADIWAFGVVLYELLTSRRLFEGETVTDVLAAVVRDPVDWASLPPGTPAPIRRLLERCLERDVRRRLRDIGEARIALEGTVGEWVEARKPTPHPAWILVVAGLTIAAAAAAIGWSLRRPPAPALRKLDIAAEGLSTEETQRAALSPDGRRIAYFAARRIHVRDLDRAEARELPGTVGARDVFWSADAREIGFYREETLFRLPLDAPEPVTIAHTGLHVNGAGACWTLDGRVVFSRGSTPLFEVKAEGGEPRVLVEPNRGAGEHHFHGCSVLPGDRGILYVIHPKDSPANTIALLAGGKSRTLLVLPGETLAGPVWSPSGHVVFGRSGVGRDGVWALPFSLERLEPTGEPFPVVAGAAGASVSADGSLLYTPGRVSRGQRLVWVSRDGKLEGTAAELPDEVGGVALSRDGRRIAVAVVDGGRRNIWAIDVERGTRTKLTPDLGFAGRPTFSPDGTQVAFALNNQTYVVAADGSSAPRVVGPGLQPAFTADGRGLAVHVVGPESRFEISLLDAAGGKEPRTLLKDAVSVRFPMFSPDGHFLSYFLGEGEATGNVANGNMMLTRVPPGEGKWQISTRGGDFGVWSPDGRRFYYVAWSEKDAPERQLMEVDVQTAPGVALGVPRPLFDLRSVGVGNQYAVAPGAGRFLMVAEESGQTAGRLVLVENWFEEFRRPR
jgi:eukaryotic-like serine/threonine-protein kinase